MNKLVITIFNILLITGCSVSQNNKVNTTANINNVDINSKTQEQWNEILIKSKSPVRLIKDSSDKDAIELIEVWAGIAGVSGISQRYQTMAFDNIQKRCGYGKD